MKLIVPYAPGSGTDLTARLFAEQLEPRLGRSIVVENHPGALGTLGTSMVVRAEPDGDTALLVGSTAITSAPFMMETVTYDPLNDLAPVFQTASSPMVLYITNNLEIETFDMFVEYAKSTNSLNYAAHNANNMLAMELLKDSFSIEMEYIPYNSGPQAMTDLASGNVDVMFNNIAGSQSLVDSGRITPLAIMSDTRSADLPEVPTLSELGYNGYIVEPWNGIFFPTGVSQEMIKLVSEEVSEVVKSPDTVERMHNIGLTPYPDSGPTDFNNVIQEEVNALLPLIERLGLKQ